MSAVVYLPNNQDFGANDEEVVRTTIFPSWLRSDHHVGRTEWLQLWSEMGVRAEVRALADRLTLTGWDHGTGRQVKAKSLAILAEDSGVSPSAVSRFLARAHAEGLLKFCSEFVTFVPGKRSTTLRRMTRPGQRGGMELPQDLHAEVAALIEVGRLADEPGQTWQADPASAPPDWAAMDLAA